MKGLVDGMRCGEAAGRTGIGVVVVLVGWSNLLLSEGLVLDFY